MECPTCVCYVGVYARMLVEGVAGMMDVGANSCEQRTCCLKPHKAMPSWWSDRKASPSCQPN